MANKRYSIDDVRAAGYTVALASGSVEVEEVALAEAKGQASAETIAVGAELVATDVAKVAVAKGATGPQLQAIVLRATERALDTLQAAADERVAFHERALEIAKELPDVYFVSALGDQGTAEDDVQLYVNCKPDGYGWDKAAQATLDALVAAAA